MGIVRMGPPQDLIIKIREKLSADHFVETGTFRGGTAFWAAKYFKTVFTIEINEAISRETAAKADCPPNIEFLVGNSRDVLPGLLPALAPNSIFWLDGHYSGPGTGGEDDECPVLEEIQIISQCVNPVIFIDDARCFMGTLPPPHKSEQWPNLDDIFKSLHHHFPNHYNTIHDDVIISVDKKYKYLVDQDWLANYEARFSSKPVEESFKQKIKKLFN